MKRQREHNQELNEHVSQVQEPEHGQEFLQDKTRQQDKKLNDFSSEEESEGGKKSFTCKQCGVVSKNYYWFLQHSKTSHNNENRRSYLRISTIKEFAVQVFGEERCKNAPTWSRTAMLEQVFGVKKYRHVENLKQLLKVARKEKEPMKVFFLLRHTIGKSKIVYINGNEIFKNFYDKTIIEVIRKELKLGVPSKSHVSETNTSSLARFFTFYNEQEGNIEVDLHNLDHKKILAHLNVKEFKNIGDLREIYKHIILNLNEDAFLFHHSLVGTWFHANIKNRKYVSGLGAEEKMLVEKNINTLLDLCGNIPNMAFQYEINHLFFPLLEKPGIKYKKFREFVMCLKMLMKVGDQEARDLVQFKIVKINHITEKIEAIHEGAKYKSVKIGKLFNAMLEAFKNEEEQFMGVGKFRWIIALEGFVDIQQCFNTETNFLGIYHKNTRVQITTDYIMIPSQFRLLKMQDFHGKNFDDNIGVLVDRENCDFEGGVGMFNRHCMVRTTQKDGKVAYVSNASWPLLKCLFCKKISAFVNLGAWYCCPHCQLNLSVRPPRKNLFCTKNMQPGEEVVNEDPTENNALVFYENGKEPKLYGFEKKLCIELNGIKILPMELFTLPHIFRVVPLQEDWLSKAYRLTFQMQFAQKWPRLFDLKFIRVPEIMRAMTFVVRNPLLVESISSTPNFPMYTFSDPFSVLGRHVPFWIFMRDGRRLPIVVGQYDCSTKQITQGNRTLKDSDGGSVFELGGMNDYLAKVGHESPVPIVMCLLRHSTLRVYPYWVPLERPFDDVETLVRKMLKGKNETELNVVLSMKKSKRSLKYTLLELFTSNVSFEVGDNTISVVAKRRLYKGTVFKRTTTTLVNRWSPPYLHVDEKNVDDWEFVKSLFVPTFLERIKKKNEKRRTNEQDEQDDEEPVRIIIESVHGPPTPEKKDVLENFYNYLYNS